MRESIRTRGERERRDQRRRLGASAASRSGFFLAVRRGPSLALRPRAALLPAAARPSLFGSD